MIARSASDPEAALRHSVDFLDAMSIAVVAWLWLLCAAVARERLHAGKGDRDHCQGKLCAAQYWIHTELPRVHALCKLCEENEDSYERMRPEWF
jgi:hypothetical protein